MDYVMNYVVDRAVNRVMVPHVRQGGRA